MIKDIKGLITALKPHSLKVDLNLLTEGIYIPEATEDLQTFSIQGGVKLTSTTQKTIKSVIIQFLGNFQNLKCNNKQGEKGNIIIENQLELLKDSLQISAGTSILEFELELPRNLPSSLNSDFIKLHYTISAIITHEGEEDQLVYQLPVKVYNNYLVPHLIDLADTYTHSGNIKNLMNYSINFSKRVFDMEESINFGVNIDSGSEVKVNSITVSLLQKENIYKDSEQSTEIINQNLQTLNRDIRLICNTCQNNQLNQFHLPLKYKFQKRSLIPSVTSTNFEVKHQIQILINYQLLGESPQIRFIQVPIAILNNFDQSSSDALPTYNQFELNSIHVPMAELPPVYCN